MLSVLELLNKTRAYFEQKGVPNANYDAQALLAKVLGCKRLDLFLRFDEPLDEARVARYREFVKRRASREPLQHILGDVEFFGVKLKSDRRALIPRHETEELCDIITREYFKDAEAPLKILDLGTGSGAISLALAAHFKNSSALGVDKSAEALALANENAAALGLEGRVKFAQGDWFEGVRGRFDIIVSNPPYLTDAEYESAQPEVKNFDPHAALVSPDDGLADLRKIMSALPDFLEDTGAAFFECGVGQPERLIAEMGLEKSYAARAVNDSSRRNRFLVVGTKVVK